MEPPHAPRSNISQPQPNWPMKPPGPSAFAPPGPVIQPPDAGVSASRMAFTQGLIFVLIGAVVAALGGIFFRALGVLVYLIVLPIPYVLAGIVASRRTGKTRTGVLASFWITFGYLLGSLLVSFRAPGRFLFVLLIALVVGTGLGALGGLLGSALRQQRGSMSKKTIGTLYLISLVLEVFPAVPLVAALTQGSIDTPTLEAIMVLSIIMALFGIPSLIAWIGTLVNLAKAQAWGWFIAVFFFGGIAVLIYLIAGPQPEGAGQTPAAVPLAASPLFHAPPGGYAYPPPAQAYPPAQPISALDILQQRYARGEIDTATFDQMRGRLEARQEQ